MEQIGTVKKTNATTAVVEVMRVSSCGENCAHCKGGCVPTQMSATVENCVGAKVGDRVKIVTSDSAVIKASIILYFVPCVLAMLGAIVAQTLWEASAVTIGVAAVVFFLSFFVIHKFDAKIAPKPKIMKVLERKVL